MLMRRSMPVLSLSLAMVLFVMAKATLADDHPHVFATRLLGQTVVPPINVPGSAQLKLAIHDTAIDFELNYSDLTGAPAVAQIHFGQAKVNGGVIVFLCGGPQPACPAATTGTVTGTLTGSMVIGPAAQGILPGDFEALVRAIRNGVAYSSMHTLRFPAGEIRGDMHPALRRD